MNIKPLAPEIALSSANTVDNAVHVRIYNDTGGAVLITNTTTGASITIPSGDTEFLVKGATDTLTAGSAVRAVKIAAGEP